jgi:hypothetical protein
MMALAREIATQKYREFSYSRGGKTEFSGAETIQSYVGYARAIDLLDADLGSTQSKKNIRDLQSFQQWLSNAVLDYLRNEGCDIKRIEGAVQTLLQLTPPKLPTQEKVRSQLQDPPSAEFFRFSLKTIALLKPAVLQAKSRKAILIPGVFEE